MSAETFFLMHPINLLSAIFIAIGIGRNLYLLFFRKEIASLFFLLFWVYLAWGLWSGNSVAPLAAIGILVEAVKRRRDHWRRRMTSETDDDSTTEG